MRTSTLDSKVDELLDFSSKTDMPEGIHNLNFVKKIFPFELRKNLKVVTLSVCVCVIGEKTVNV